MMSSELIQESADGTWAFGSTPTGCFPGSGNTADSGMIAGTALAER